jgi:hypothetical protein
MSRLPSTGALIVSPFRGQEELGRVLTNAGVQELSPTEIHDLYFDLAAIIGRWASVQQRLEASSVAKALLSLGTDLSEASLLLAGLETGFHTDLEIAVASRLAKYLALDPNVGSLERARELISLFRQEAERMAHVAMVARADLPDVLGERGRRVLDWYDDFTALLLKLANRAGLKPTLSKDRITGARSGWLLDAAQALELFLYREMRSPSHEACGKRLERSLRRLKDRKRQKSPGS